MHGRSAVRRPPATIRWRSSPPTACSTCRTASSSRQIAELPFGVGKRWANGRVADLLIGGWTVAGAITLQSGFPINVQQAADSRLGGANANRPNLTGADLATPGRLCRSAGLRPTIRQRPGSIRRRSGLAPAGTFGNAPRAQSPKIRGPGWYLVDASFIKDFRLGGTKVAQFKLEALNIMKNRPNVRTLRARTPSATRISARRRYRWGFRESCS